MINQLAEFFGLLGSSGKSLINSGKITNIADGLI
jgi:hypothetical protein